MVDKPDLLDPYSDPHRKLQSTAVPRSARQGKGAVRFSVVLDHLLSF